MTLYKNITEKALIVDGLLVEAGATIEHKLIENANFAIVEVEKAAKAVAKAVEIKADSSIADTPEDDTIKVKEETK